MVFSSLTFIFIFLPIVIFLYFIVKDKYKNYILLLFSLIFYSWGEPKYILIILMSIIFNYLLALAIDKYKNIGKLLFIFAVIFNIGLLFAFKYLNFIIISINDIFSLNLNLVNISLPIGISFYTFQNLSYIIDVYLKRVNVQKNIFIYATYVSLFPQLIAGPIIRYSSIEEYLNKRNHSLDKIADGFRRFIVGFSKKIIISNNVAVISDAIFNNYSIYSIGAPILLIGVLSYTIQIYYDFSGYSDMAIGLGKVFGFNFDENFDYPYSAKSITEFWKKWHISLTNWFRDYVYIPLGGNRVSKFKWIRNMLIVWLITGFWHGAGVNYIVWGIYYFIILVIEKLFFNKILNKLPVFLRWIYTFILINIGWIIFRLENINILINVLNQLFTFRSSNMTDFLLENYNLINKLIFLIIGFIFMFPINKLLKKHINNRLILFFRDIFLILIFIISICFLVNDSYNPFIYFRF